MKAARFDFLAVFSAQNIVFTAMLAVGALCIFMSASNTTSYLVLTGMNDMIAIPAIFYDIIAPLAMTVVLFLMGFRAKNEKEGPAKKLEREKQPDIKDITEYIERAMQKDYSLLADDTVPDMEARQCAVLREFLMQFRYKGSPVISGSDGRYISIFDKDNLKRFIKLQYNVQRIH
jgi:hypothetical protein